MGAYRTPVRMQHAFSRWWAYLIQGVQWHRYCATRFLGMESGPFGTGVPKSTAKQKVMEFCDYMTQIEAWACDQFPGWTFDYEQRAAA